MKRKLTCRDAIKIKTLREHGYDLSDGWIVAVKEGKQGSMQKQLANFLAWPEKEIHFDDGVEPTRYFDVQGILANGKALNKARLTHAEFFGSLQKALSRHWGMDVIIKARAKDDLREAMQVLGENRKRETIYTHTGWRELEGKWIFLHAGGAVGADDVSVDLSEGGEVLTRYSLPDQVVRKIMCKPPLSGKIELDNGGFELWRKKRKANFVN